MNAAIVARPRVVQGAPDPVGLVVLRRVRHVPEDAEGQILPEQPPVCRVIAGEIGQVDKLAEHV